MRTRRTKGKDFFEPISCFLLLGCAVLATAERKFQARTLYNYHILLNTGSVTTNQLEDDQGRLWTPDFGSGAMFQLLQGQTFRAQASVQKPAVPQVPYMTAAIFVTPETYSFPVESPGRNTIRLSFYPAPYVRGLDVNNAVFSVTCGPYTLLKNFNAAETAKNLNLDFFDKEFMVYTESNTLNITFSPETSNPMFYAFVNGIEIVPHPMDIYDTTKGNVMLVGSSTAFVIDDHTAFETVYRLNVGGQEITPLKDYTGMARSWDPDTNYIFGAAVGIETGAEANFRINYPKSIAKYVAPDLVYKSARTMGPNAQIDLNYNLTWSFPVDGGFPYLVRLHFCEFSKQITRVNQRVFDVFINNQMVEKQADVIVWGSGRNGVPVYKDYVVLVAGKNTREDILVGLHPNTASKPQYYDAILNGLEIHKINTTDGNLGGKNPPPPP